MNGENTRGRRLMKKQAGTIREWLMITAGILIMTAGIYEFQVEQ